MVWCSTLLAVKSCGRLVYCLGLGCCVSLLPLILVRNVAMSYLGVGVSPGNVPVYHGSDLNTIDSKVRLAELFLRCLIFGLAVVSVGLIVSDTQTREIFTLRKKAKFSDMKSTVFVVVINGLASAYSLIQVLRCIMSMIRGSVLFNKSLAWAIFSGDQIMTYLALAAVSASMQSGMFAKFGQAELQWMRLCGMYEKYCDQSAAGMATALLASCSMVVLSGISAFSLFRLYEDNVGKSSGRW